MGDTIRRGRTFVVGLCLVCAIGLLFRWPVADVPLERDEGEYAYIAQRWLQGDVPYVDAFDQKPPGVFVAYAIIESLIGTSPRALHWGAQVYTLCTLLVIALIGRMLLNERAGLLAALFAAFMTTDYGVLGNAANTEMFMILPLAGGFLCTLLAVERASVGWAFAAGVLGCLAMQFKQVALQNAVYNGLLLVILARPRLRSCAAYVAGGIVAMAPTILYFGAVGALYDFYDCVVGHNLAYAQRMPLQDYPIWFWYSFSFIMGRWWPILAFAVIGLFGRGRVVAFSRPTRRVLGTWLLFSFLGVCVGGYFRDHYYFQIIPAVAVLAGRGLTMLADRVLPRFPALFAWPAAALAISLGIFINISAELEPHGHPSVRMVIEATTRPWYFGPGDPIVKAGNIYGNCPFGESLAVADYIRLHSTPDEMMFVYGSEPQIPYYAGRKNASRYIFVYPLMTPFADTRDRQAGVLDELEQNRPRFIVVAKQGSSFFDDDLTPTLLADGMTRLLNEQYRLVGYAGGCDTEVRPFTGPIVNGDVPRPIVEHTLAVWRRVDVPPEGR